MLLRDVFTALATLEVTFINEQGTNVTVRAKDLDETPDSVENNDCPMRVLMPLADQGAESEPGEVLGAGKVSVGQITWSIVDAYLQREQGVGKAAEQLPNLVRYAEAYAETISKNVLPLDEGYMRLKTFDIQPGQVEYPINSGRVYWGVVCVLRYVYELECLEV